MFCAMECYRLYQKSGDHEFTRERKDAIRESFSKGKTIRWMILHHPKFTNVPRQQIYEWAAELGIPLQETFGRWETWEEEVLKNNAETKSAHQIHEILKRKGGKRTLLSVQRKMSRESLTNIRDVYSAQDVAAVVRCPNERVQHWLSCGELVGHKEVSNRWTIKPIDLAVFIRDYAEAVNQYRVDIPFLISLMDEFGRGDCHRRKEKSCNGTG
jgi:hypothetical protein